MEKERETAESVRKRSMEILAETREKESQGYGKKRKKNGGDREAIDYFRGKYDKEFNFKREELELRRRREIEMKEKEKERQWEVTKREIEMKEKEKERQWEIKKREFEMKEREWEARSKRESEMMAVMQHHLQQQQELQKQMQEQNKLMLDIMKKLFDKFM